MRVLTIDDPSDPRIAEYRGVRDADLLGRHGVFMAEGRFVVRTLLSPASRFRARSLLLTEPALESLHTDLAHTHHQDLPVYLARQEVMNATAGFNIHRGCLAAAERSPALDAAPLLEAPGGASALIVVLEDLANHDNVGGIFRSAGALGAAAVLLTPRTVDPLYRKAIRVSMGGVLRVPFARVQSSIHAAGLLHESGWTVLALTPGPGAKELDDVARSIRRPARIAILVGAEGPGLSSGALQAADGLVRISIAGGVDSLNAAVAASIAMHRLGPLSTA